jgi:mevalonate kinase
VYHFFVNSETKPAVITSAPGSLMLLGEHAVLHGHYALVGAINRRITVELIAIKDRSLYIHSALGDYCSPLHDLVDHPSFRFVLQAVRQHEQEMLTGLKLRIKSEFSSDIGFGSSAAVTVAVHAALMRWMSGVEPSPKALFKQALETVHTVQGRGSGADLAAAVFGGCTAYNTTPEFQPVEITVPLTAVYCGYKTPTPEVIAKVDAMRAADPEKFKQIYREIDLSVQDAITCLHEHDLPGFGEILNENQKLMTQMGVNTPELQQIVSALQQDPDVFGAKISGSGLGDCAIGIGVADVKGLDFPLYHLQITPSGIEYHD